MEDLLRLGSKEGELTQLLRRAGISDVEEGMIGAGAHYESFDD